MYYRDLRTDRARECIFRAFRGTILKMYTVSVTMVVPLWIWFMYWSAPKDWGYVTGEGRLKVKGFWWDYKKNRVYEDLGDGEG